MVVQMRIYNHKFILTLMAACGVSLLAVMISAYDFTTTLAVALGSFISTLAAFRWYWSTRYGWENYLVSIRPLFQTISYIWLILGPLPAVAGLARFMVYPGAIDYYWLMYLMAPCAFIFYELGYERSLGRRTKALQRFSPKTISINSDIITFSLYIVILLYFTHFSTKYGIIGIGISDEATKEGLIIKALFYIYDGLFGACLFLITTKWLNCDPKKRFIYLIMGLTLFGILALSSSRTNAVTISVMCLAAAQLCNNKFYKNIKYLLIIPILLILTTAVREELFGNSRYQNVGMSVDRRVELIHNALQDQRAAAGTAEHLKVDFAYRVNGIEWAGAILYNHETLGAPFMCGENFFWGAFQAVPEVFLPFPKITPAEVTNSNFNFTQWDPNGSIFASMIADAGLLGIIIGYFAIGLFNGALWRYAASTKTPQYAKLAYLALIPGLMHYQDSLGEYIFINIRYAILFAIIFWIIIKLSELLLPPTRSRSFFTNRHLLETSTKD